MPTSKRIASLFLAILLSLGLTGCQSESQDPVRIGKEVVLTQDRLEEEADFFYRAQHQGADLSAADPEEKEELFRQVAKEWAMEELVLRDTKLHADPTEETSELWTQALARFDNEEGLLAQLHNYGISKEDFLASLRRQGSLLAHRKAYQAAHPLQEKELQSYYKKHRNTLALLSYTQITVPTKSEAEALRKAYQKEPARILEVEEDYQGDLYGETSFTRYVDMPYEDPRMLEPAIFKQEVGTLASYFLRQDKVYLLVWLEEKKDDFSTLEERVRSGLLEENYQAYLNSLAKDLDLRLKTSFPQAEEEASQSGSEE